MQEIEGIQVEDRRFLQYMLNAIELQLTWPYSEEEKADLKKRRDEIIKALSEYDEEHDGENKHE